MLSFLMMMGKDEKDATDFVLGLGLPLMAIGGSTYYGSMGNSMPKQA